MTHLSSITSSHIICDLCRRWFPEMVDFQKWFQPQWEYGFNHLPPLSVLHQQADITTAAAAVTGPSGTQMAETEFGTFIRCFKFWNFWNYHLTSGALNSGEMSPTPGFTKALRCSGRKTYSQATLAHARPTDRSRYILECIHFTPLIHLSYTTGMRNSFYLVQFYPLLETIPAAVHM